MKTGKRSLTYIRVILAMVFIVISARIVYSQDGAPLMFHCAYDDSCPEILITGDPIATLNNVPAPFRGIGDPSLEYDPATRVLWLTYSWLDTIVTTTDSGVGVNFGVRTHLAQSSDNGRSFQYVDAINAAERVAHPGTNQPMWTINEVSTLLHQPDGDWQVLWLSYFAPVGQTGRNDFHIVRSLAETPSELGQETENWVSGWAINSSVTVRHNLSTVVGLEDCATFTEPGLFAYHDAMLLAANCIVLDSQRLSQQFEQSRMVLLRQTDDGYTLIGTLLDYADAQSFGADEFTQADLSMGRDDSILLTVTPLIDGSDPRHQGCMVFEINDIMSAAVIRDTDGVPLPRVIISADGNGLGPGLCTYDANSETGVMLIITQVDLDSNPPDIVFSLRATGVHP